MTIIAIPMTPNEILSVALTIVLIIITYLRYKNDKPPTGK